MLGPSAQHIPRLLHSCEDCLTNMKSRPIQFGVRENTASPRQHAPRFAENVRSNAISIEEENSEVAEDSLLADAFPKGSKSRLHATHATSQHAATDGEGR